MPSCKFMLKSAAPDEQVDVECGPEDVDSEAVPLRSCSSIPTTLGASQAFAKDALLSATDRCGRVMWVGDVARDALPQQREALEQFAMIQGGSYLVTAQQNEGS